MNGMGANPRIYSVRLLVPIEINILFWSLFMSGNVDVKLYIMLGLSDDALLLNVILYYQYLMHIVNCFSNVHGMHVVPF